MTKTESFTYDYLGRTLTFNAARVLEGSLNVPYTWKKEYDYQGNVIKQFNAEENFISKEYNVFGQLEKIYDYKSNLL